jgi:hypothetical protein
VASPWVELLEDHVRKLWVFLLAAIAFASGAFATLIYSGVAGSFASFTIACELLNTAEASGMLQRAQRTNVVDRVILEMRKSGSDPDPRGVELVGQLKVGCPNLPSW